MPRADFVNLLTIWAPLLAAALLWRRDRRLALRPLTLFILSSAALLISGLTWLVLRGTPPDAWATTTLSIIAALCGGAGLIVLLTWARAWLRQDLPRVWRLLSAAPGWTAACAGLGLVSFAAYLTLGAAIEARGGLARQDLLFNADTTQWLAVMRDTLPEHGHIVLKHPLFPLIARGLAVASAPLTGDNFAGIATSAFFGAVSAGLAAEYFRRVTGSRLSGWLLAALLAFSAAHLVFASIPETYTASAAGLIALHLLLAGRPGGAVRLRHEAPIAVFATGMTATHAFTAAVCWLAGRARFWPGAVARWSAMCLALGAAALMIQSAAIPSAALNFDTGGAFGAERGFIEGTGQSHAGTRLANVARGFLSHNVIAPTPTIGPHEGSEIVQLGTYADPIGWLCAAAWSVTLLCAALSVIWRRETRTRTFWAAATCLAAAAGLHVFYGNEYVFLFSCTYTFYVVANVAHALGGAKSRPPAWTHMALGLLLMLVMINNVKFMGQLLVRVEQL